MWEYNKAFLSTSVAMTFASWIFMPGAAIGNPIDRWAWAYRPLVVFSPDSGHKHLAEQRKLLSQVRADLIERDMTIVEIVDGEAAAVLGPKPDMDAQALIDRLRFEGDRFEVVLIGKDTSVKLRSDRPVAPEDVFALIDRMPMRRQEMMRDEN